MVTTRAILKFYKVYRDASRERIKGILTTKDKVVGLKLEGDPDIENAFERSINILTRKIVWYPETLLYDYVKAADTFFYSSYIHQALKILDKRRKIKVSLSSSLMSRYMNRKAETYRIIRLSDGLDDVFVSSLSFTTPYPSRDLRLNRDYIFIECLFCDHHSSTCDLDKCRAISKKYTISEII